MRKTYLFLLALICALLPCGGTQAQQMLAFPGADGYGKHVTGGRGGEVCYVTRTDDCADNDLVEGTLRWAIRHDNGGKPRTVLFATAGTFYLTSKLKLQYDNISILGQSAPGGGVTITGYPLVICKNNVIIRYLRFRAGDAPSASLTGLDMENCDNAILDHCSMTWSMEECLTAYDTDYTTVQWCIIGEGLYNSKNSKGARAYATQWGGEHSSMHHSLITNSHSRSPRFNGVRNTSTNPGDHDQYVDSEFANNVVYNWSSHNSIYGGENYPEVKGYNRVYMINNYFRPGPSTQKGTASRRYFISASGSAETLGQWYLKGNKFETSSKFAPNTTVWSDAELEKVNADNLYGIIDNNASRAMGYWSVTPTQEIYDKSIMTELPYALSGMTYESADEAYRAVTSKAGASLPRYDEVDSRLLREAAGTADPEYTGSLGELGIIDSPSDIKLSARDTYVAEGVVAHDMPLMFIDGQDKYAIDSDADGLPDGYEDEIGLDKNDASDGAATAANGYTNLENYLNGIADGTVDKTKYETSAEFIAPGPAANPPATVTAVFSNSDKKTQGKVPSQITVNYGEPITLPANTSLYKQGYTLTGWTCAGKIYSPGQTVTLKNEKETIRPVFTANPIELKDRTEDVTATWDFTSAATPALTGNGIYVTQAELAGAAYDIKLNFANTNITLPSSSNAKITVATTDGTETLTAEGDTYKYDAAGKELKSITVLFPYVKVTEGTAGVTWKWDGTPAAEATKTPPTVFTAATASYDTGSFTTSSNSAFSEAFASFKPNAAAQFDTRDINYALTFDIQPADEVYFMPQSISFKAVKFGTDSGVFDVTLEQDGEEKTVLEGGAFTRNSASELKETVIDLTQTGSLTSSSGPLKMRIYLYSMYPGKSFGFNGITVSGKYSGNAPEVKTYTFAAAASPEAAATVSWTPEGTAFDDGTQIEVTAKGKRGYLFEGWTNQDGERVSDKESFTYTIKANTELTATYRTYDDYGYIFDAAPFDAAVKTVNELKVALSKAAQRTDQTQRYRIFLHNGIYDFGTQAKTEVRGAVSLIGESQDGVVITNKPVATGNHADSTPTLFIDQNQNDVYMQDLTVRQGQDWDTQVSTGQAMAIRQRGKYAIYKNVTLQGIQDTYYLNKGDGSAYFENCTIAGQTDYVYGDGTAWFEECTLYNTGAGYITAPNTPVGKYGFIFSNCTVKGSDAAAGKYCLGRPWSESPFATFLHTRFEQLPTDAGWGKMTDGLVVRFHEYGSTDANGSAIDLSKRSIAACNPAEGSDNPVLTDSEMGIYDKKLTGILGWTPENNTIQTDAPTMSIDEEAKTMSWTGDPRAIGYAIVRDGSVVAFTTELSYDISKLGAGRYSVRGINSRGGLGAASNETTGISQIKTDAEKKAHERYNLKGQRISKEYKGVVVQNGRKYLKR